MEKIQIIITGASGSIGSATVRAMAQRGCSVIMACRNLEKGESVKLLIMKELPEADLQVMQVDMASKKSILSFVETLKGNGVRLSGLFNNAGTLNRDFRLTDDGFEQTVAVNYLGHYMLSRLLLPLMTEDANIVSMVSLSCRYGHLDRDFFQKGASDFRQIGTYADSKLALLLFMLALAKHTGCRVNLADPGVVNSNMIHMNRWFDPLADILFRPFCNTPEKGARPAVNALCSHDTLRYYVGKGDKDIPRRYLNHELIDWLWDETERKVF